MIAPDGRHLYLSLRGDEDSLVAYSNAKATGQLTETQRVSFEGKVPLSFAIDFTRCMLITNEASTSDVEFSVNGATRALAPTSKHISVPRQVTVTFSKHQRSS